MATELKVDQYKADLKKRCNALLLALLGKEEFCTSWWSSENIGFELRTPADAFDDNPLRVYNYLAFHANVGGGS